MKNDQLNNEKEIQTFVKNNFPSYKNDYDEISSLISENTENKLKGYASQITRKWKVDSLMIFNSPKTKLFTTVNTITNVWEKGSSDLVKSLYGVKIKGKWHVYLGNQNLIAMREGYKTNKYEPFTWEELSYVAHEQMFVSFIEFDKTGVFIPRPDLVDKRVNPRDVCGRNYINEAQEEDGFLKCTLDRNSKKIDSLQYQELLNEINNPLPKEQDPIEKLSWWDKLWGAEVPIFDTKEWKEFVKNKNKVE